MSLNREQIRQEVMAEIVQSLTERFGHEKEQKLANYRQQNAYIQKGRTLFTGSSLMELFPVTEYCLNESLPVAYNRGIGGYTTDEFLAAVDTVLLDPQPSVPTISVPCRKEKTGSRIFPPIIGGSVKSSGKSCRTPRFI